MKGNIDMQDIYSFNGIAVVQLTTHDISENVDLDFNIEKTGDEWNWTIDGYGKNGFIVSNDTFNTREDVIKNANDYGNAWVEMREDGMRAELIGAGMHVAN